MGGAGIDRQPHPRPDHPSPNDEDLMRTASVISALAFAAGLPATEPPTCRAGEGRPTGTIAFSSLAPRGWDLYLTDIETRQTRRLTDHPALDFNAAFAPAGGRLAFVSERDGNAELYTVQVDGDGLRRLTNEFALDDRPAWSPDGRRVAFSSTRQPAEEPGRSWNAVYVMEADGGSPHRLTPAGSADYSPAWSPGGDLIAVASGSGEAGGTDLFVMDSDGNGRRRVIADGGWPTFAADGRSLFFHSKREGKWGIWRVNLDGSGLERITPPDVDSYTPSASADGKRLVAAVGRGGHRQIVAIDLASRSLTDLTEAAADHWNPTISPDGRSVAYHLATPDSSTPNVEIWGVPPDTSLRLLRVAGAFPAFSPDGRRVALTGGSFARLDVMNVDGSARQMLYSGSSRTIFSVSWAHSGDRIAFSQGPVFQGPGGKVDIATVRPDGSGYAGITQAPGNDGFPSFAPDGKEVVFRSGRGGSKNLYIMAADGSGIRRLTEGRWTDTMCDWSPTGEWVAFASDRDGDFEVWLIHPDGSGLHKLVGGSRNNHPHFSPDGRWVVFTSKRAGFSAEEVSLPQQPQPYGDLFAARVDGTGLIRLTHNGFEEGTPAWGPVLEIKATGEGGRGKGEDY
jgi:Tol biopolymer transport system component